ncbi:MAG: hypothetical protein ACR2LF_11610 [Jatrophihabitantaceae bacterium]
MSIHWADLARVAEASLGFGVGIAVVFALGVLGLSRLDGARSGERASGTGSWPGARVAARGALVVSAVAFTACAAAVGYGLYLIIPQLHS